jgi:hypothetical protein
MDSENNLFPTAINFENDNLVCGDWKGYSFKFSTYYYHDLEIDTTKVPSLWNVQPIIYKYKHIPFDFNEPIWNKWVNKVSTFTKNESDLNLQLNSYDNLNGIPSVLKEITYINPLVWDDYNWIWGDADDIWDEQITLVNTRWMVAGKLRSKFKQLEFTNTTASFISYSDSTETATISTATGNNTATLTNFHWDKNIIGDTFRYELVAGSGIYSPYYNISQRVSDGVMKFDGGLTTNLSLTNRKWDIIGTPIDQRLHLMSFEYSYDVISDKNNYFVAGQQGGNT